MGMLSEFKDFAAKGNLVDMAVAFVMGGAFAKVVSSFIDNIVMPPVGMLIGGEDFVNLAKVIRPGSPAVVDANGVEVTAAVSEIAIKYGDFITALITFIIVAFIMFLIVKATNKMKAAEAEAVAGPSAEEVLLGEIRDLLKK